MDIELIKIDDVTRKVSLTMGPRPVKGLTKLTQLVILSLLNVPGKDILDPDWGAGIPEMIGMNLDPGDLSEVLSEITRRVKMTETELLKDQTGLQLDTSERLREVRIISVGPGNNPNEVNARLRIVNELGQQSDVVI